MPRAPSPARPLELAERDFELLADARARREELNPERLELRRKLGDAGKMFAEHLKKGCDLSLDSHTSLHHPASFNAFRVDNLRAYMSRDKRSRAALLKVLGSSFKQDINSAYRHACLGLTMDHDGLSIHLTIHPDAWWDAQNMVGKTKQREGAMELAARLNAATGFSLRVHEHRDHPSGSIRRDELERALLHFKIGEHYLRVTRKYPKVAVLAADPQEMTDALAADLVLLAPVQQWIAWSPENDFLFAAGAAS